jgi:hypothetical protein
VQNEFAFHALAIDEQRRSFEPTLWTKTTDNADPASASPPRPLAQVEQRWFVGAHANVGGGYANDVLAQPPLEWLMGKAAALGLQFRNTYVPDGQSPMSPIADSFREFAHGFGRFFTRRFDRPIGIDPEKGTMRTTERINETIDGSVHRCAPCEGSKCDRPLSSSAAWNVRPELNSCQVKLLLTNAVS